MANKPTTDGFYPRRPNTRAEFGGMGFNAPEPKAQSPHSSPALRPAASPAAKKDTFSVPTAAHASHPAGSGKQQPGGLTRSELEESLRDIDNENKKDKKKAKKPRKRATRKQIIIRIIIGLVLIVLAIGGFMLYKLIRASGNVFNGDLLGLVQQEPLKEDANGRSNIVIFGTSEDDEGGDHPGAYLTDSMMILSVNQTKKDAYMVGIPRDLWVKYDRACTSGYEGKINALFTCYSNNGADDAAGSKALMEKISEVSGLTIQYYVHVNYGVVRDAVNAVGGIDLTIPDYDPNSPGIYDPNFDWKCRYTCKMVNYKDGEQVHMDGEHALAFARARNANGGYGLPNGNFDREKNQQLVLTALKEKATSVGTLANFVAVTNLIEAMGNNMRTNFETKEIRTLMSLGTDIKTDAIHSIDLTKEGEAAVTTGAGPDGSSIVRPITGIYDYSSIIKYIKKQLSAEPFMSEDALVIVLNGSGVAGQGKVLSDKLADMGFSVATPANAPSGQYAKHEVYARSETAFPATFQKLKSLYGSVQVSGFEKFTVPAEVDFVIVVGEAE